MQVTELMTRDPVTLTPEESIATAAELMQSKNIRHLPIVDGEGDLVGMISDRDVRGLLLPYFQGGRGMEYALAQVAVEAPIRDIMTAEPLAIDMDSDAADAAELMIENQLGSIPVVDGDGALVGIVSYVDLLRHYVRSGA